MMYHIDGEIQPFGVHEIHYNDARYFVDTPKEGQLSAAKDNALMKVTKTTKLNQKKVSFLHLKTHFGSDMVSSEEGGDEDIEITHPSSQFYKRSKHFDNDDYDGEEASLPQSKKDDDDDDCI